MLSYEGRNRRTVNYLKTVYFDYPEWTPAGVGFLPAAWIKYREDLEALVLAHPRVFPGFKKGSKDYDAVGQMTFNEGKYTDSWGCVWENIQRGCEAAVTGHPLADWAAFETWTPPDPLTQGKWGPQENWDEVRRNFAQAKARGGLADAGGLPHGHMFLRLTDLRGYTNFLMDVATNDPRLARLTAIVENYCTTIINKYVELGAEAISLGDDLGMQTSLPMSPEAWRKFLKPSYMKMLAECRRRDLLVYLHTDGHILEIIPDLMEAGVKMLNPQIRANGLEGLQKMARGKVAICQDLDRQLFPFAAPSRIEDHIGEVFEGLYLKKGGLSLSAECGPDVPLANVEAICRTFEKLCRLPEPEA